MFIASLTTKDPPPGKDLDPSRRWQACFSKATNNNAIDAAEEYQIIILKMSNRLLVNSMRFVSPKPYKSH